MKLHSYQQPILALNSLHQPIPATSADYQPRAWLVYRLYVRRIDPHQPGGADPG